MSDALIADLRRQLDEKNAALASANAESADRRKKGSQLKKDHEALVAEHARAIEDRDRFKAAAETAPDEWKAKHDDLQKQVVARDHRDAFRGVGEFKVKVKDAEGKDVEKSYKLHDKATAEKVWAEIGYRAEGDAPTAEAVAEHYGKALEAAPYLFSEAQAAPGGATNPGANRGVRPGPGAGRGLSEPSPSVQSQIDAAHGSRPAGRIA